jgi:hypothetical protein
LWELVRELRAAVNIELSQEDEGTVLGVETHVGVGAGTGTAKEV